MLIILTFPTCLACGWQASAGCKGMRSCIKCKAKEQQGKGKGKGKRKRKREEDSSEGESSEEEEEYDESLDEQLGMHIDERIRSMVVGAKVEMVIDTSFGKSWEWGVISPYDGKYIVDWVDDDTEGIYEKRDLRLEKWKYLI